MVFFYFMKIYVTGDEYCHIQSKLMQRLGHERIKSLNAANSA